MSAPKIRARASYFDKIRGEFASSELTDLTSLEIGIIDRDDGADVVVSAATFLEQQRTISELRRELEMLRKESK